MPVTLFMYIDIFISIYIDMIRVMPKRLCWNQDDKITGEIVTEDLYKIP